MIHVSNKVNETVDQWQGQRNNYRKEKMDVYLVTVIPSITGTIYVPIDAHCASADPRVCLY